MAEGREATRARLRGSQEKSLVVTMGTVGFGLQPGRMNVPRAAGLELLLSRALGPSVQPDPGAPPGLRDFPSPCSEQPKKQGQAGPHSGLRGWEGGGGSKGAREGLGPCLASELVYLQLYTLLSL